MAECLPSKQDVAGSNPVSRSLVSARLGGRSLAFFEQVEAEPAPQCIADVQQETYTQMDQAGQPVFDPSTGKPKSGVRNSIKKFRKQ